jgi:phosphoribosylaminoimidazolecarboxamide formyltransferase/IMP cyclohydrolase
VGKIERALISVSNKEGLLEFARRLADLGVEIVSTGGTAALLRNNGVPVKDVSELTGFPEMMDGRVKTLHPRVHGGILGLRDHPEHLAQMKQHEILPIDLVVVNLYPFEATVQRGAPLEEVIEQIDIGGPSMVRSAAKNHRYVGVVVDPADYPAIVAELTKGAGLSDQTRFRLASKAFQYTARYDGAISNFLSSLNEEKKPGAWSESLSLQFAKLQDLRQPGGIRRQREATAGQRVILQQYFGCGRGFGARDGVFSNRSGGDQTYQSLRRRGLSGFAGRRLPESPQLGSGFYFRRRDRT